MDTTSILLSLAVIAASLVVGGALLARRRRRHRRRYEQVLAQALADGVLSPEEREELERLRREKDLTAGEVRMAARAIYRSALREAAADDVLTPEEDEALRRLQETLGLSEAELRGADLTQVSRLRMLARITEGHFPEVKSPVPLVPEEVCHWVVQCTLADRLSIPTGRATAFRGTTWQIAGDAAFAPTRHLTALRPADDILPSDLGMLVVTSRRTVFQGARRTLSVPHARVDAVTVFADGLRLDELRPTPQRYFLVDDADLTAALLLHTARKRRLEIRPAAARDRSA